MIMKKTLLVISLLILLVLSACNAALPQADSTPKSYPNPSYPNPIQTQAEQASPLTEADVPRVTVEESKLAFDNGEAVIVDVRSAEAYAAGHAAGAINIPLDQFENNIANVPLEKDQWIIPYCT
jgi:3-mercaptopyruvate sulfurtransferase SseA